MRAYACLETSLVSTTLSTAQWRESLVEEDGSATTYNPLFRLFGVSRAEKRGVGSACGEEGGLTDRHQLKAA